MYRRGSHTSACTVTKSVRSMFPNATALVLLDGPQGGTFIFWDGQGVSAG